MLYRLGFPDIRAHRRFVAALALDAIGSGAFMPVAVLYFVRTTTVPLDEVGYALSLAALVAFPATLVLGQLVDRIGAKRVLLLANALCGLGFALYALADSFWSVLAVVSLTAAGMAGFWASLGPLVASISSEGEREKWFGFLGALRNVGFAVGGLLSGLVVAAGTRFAYDLVVWANAASCLASFVLVATIRVGEPVPSDERPTVTTWGVVLRDREYRLLVLANLGYALASLALSFAMPVYAVQILGLPGWVAGAIFTLNTVLVGFGQTAVVARMTGHVRSRILEASSVAFSVGFALMALAGYLPEASAVVVALVAAFVYTLGEILGGPILTTLAADSRPAHARGRYMAYHQLSWHAASVIAPATFGLLLTQGRLAVWAALVALMAVGIVLARLLSTRLPLAGQPVTNAAAEPTA